MIEQTIGLSGHFRMARVDVSGDTERVVEEREFPNMILDVGLQRFCQDYKMQVLLNAIHVGTGNTPVVSTQTSLAAFKAGTSSYSPGVSDYIRTYVEGDGSAPYFQVVVTLRFAPGTAAGNLTEVGASYRATQSEPLSCRALILDSNNQPTAITVLPTEALDVTYTLRMYVSTAINTSTITVAGNAHTVRGYISRQPSRDAVHASTWLAESWTHNTGDHGWGTRSWSAVTTPGTPLLDPVGTRIQDVDWTARAVAYQSGTYHRDREVVSKVGTFPTGKIAATEVRWYPAGPLYHMEFTPPLNIDVTQTITMICRMSVQRRAS